jgi:hypothetical protein
MTSADVIQDETYAEAHAATSARAAQGGEEPAAISLKTPADLPTALA